MAITLVRRILLPPLDTLKERLFSGFAVSHSTEDEYAATVYCREEKLGDILDTLGFSSSFVSALKIRYDRNREDGSYIMRDSLFDTNQLHVVSHARDDADAIDLYAHLERSTIRHPIQHYRKVDYDANTGVERLRDMLNEHQRQSREAPAYEIQPPRHRSWAWALHLLSFVSTPAAVRLGRFVERYG